ncbi:hypothetical protein SLEP1_g23003 [Rubroshorea leprosula]|uniref:Uncharacterized protein n=1 Tax=Rubroshorea leprosula TaxID=152421 RepID=A0AAV5JAX0_9ROSI|nr:hypothetical protein SLEP1_g23003 [Rubroshorea leprosula]
MAKSKRLYEEAVVYIFLNDHVVLEVNAYLFIQVPCSKLWNNRYLK